MSAEEQQALLAKQNKDGEKGAKDKGGEKKDDKEKAPHKFPQFATRKLKKDCLESSIAACFRLQAARSMQVHMALSYAAMIVVQLITWLTQAFVVFIFNATTASAAVGRYSELMVNTQIGAIKGALAAAHAGTPSPLGPLQGKACTVQRAPPWLGYLMMFMWLAMMIKQVVDTLELIKIIVMLPEEKPTPWDKEDKDKDPNKEDENNSYKQIGKDKDKIASMAFKWQLFCLLFILLPQLGLEIFITTAGIRFLAMTGAPGRLIMKAMALKFILSFGKLFYLAFASTQFTRYMGKVKYQWERSQQRNYWNSWLSSLFKLFLVVLGVGLAWYPYSHVLKLRHYCRQYYEVYPPPCVGSTCGLAGAM